MAFMGTQRIDDIFVSDVTLAELRYGIEVVSNTNRRAALTAWLNNSVRPMFAGRTLPISEDVMLEWRLLVEEGRKSGYTYAQPDLVIGATALHHGLTIVTRNTGDFVRTGAPVFNPWVDLL